MNDKMNDSWEDWEDENIVIPVIHVPNKEQIKRIEERKKIEESEIALMKDFFDNNGNTNSTNSSNNKETHENTKHKQKIVSKQRENELKQKELSIKLKQKKEAEKKHSDVFGEVIHDKYHEYYEYDKY
jgi:hypothetical protein